MFKFILLKIFLKNSRNIPYFSYLSTLRILLLSVILLLKYNFRYLEHFPTNYPKIEVIEIIEIIIIIHFYYFFD